MTLKESGLSKLLDWMIKYDTGIITAFRKEYNYQQNMSRNKKLLAMLLNTGWNVTSVKGGFIENYGTPKAVQVSENTFFVVDYKKQGNLEKTLRALGKEFKQDSILYIPEGGQVSELWGTSKDNEFPEYDKKIDFENVKFGLKRPFEYDTDSEEHKKGDVVSGYEGRPDPQFFTKKSGRPFFFESIHKEYSEVLGYFGKWGCSVFAKTSWEKLVEDHPTIKYIGYTRFPEASKSGGYWYNGSEVLDVSASTHIKAIMSDPEKFGIDEKYIQEVYTVFGEPYGIEGKAREEIIKDVSKNGWIRIRHYARPNDYWSIQCDMIARNRGRIKDFCRWAIEHNLMGYNDDVYILGYNDPKDKLVFDYTTGGVGSFLHESELKESSWSRIINHISQGINFAVISACHSDDDINGWKVLLGREVPAKEVISLNKEAHTELKLLIKEKGYGYIEQKSVYGGKEEFSLFITGISKKEAIELGVELKQQTIIYKDNEFFGLIYTLNFKDNDGSHSIGVVGGTFNQEPSKNSMGKPVMTFDPAVLKYANSQLFRGSKNQTKQSFAYVMENVTWYEYVILERLSGLKALKEKMPTEYWQIIIE